MSLSDILSLNFSQIFEKFSKIQQFRLKPCHQPCLVIKLLLKSKGVSYYEKRWIHPLIAAFCLSALVMSGCSDGNTETESSGSSSSASSAASSGTPTPTEEPTPTVDPSAMGEGAAPTDMPDTDGAIQAAVGEACTFSQDGQELYTVTITDISFTDRRAVIDTEEPEQVLVATYTYQSLTDDPVLVG